jgi:hypothetical protein
MRNNIINNIVGAYVLVFVFTLGGIYIPIGYLGYYIFHKLLLNPVIGFWSFIIVVFIGMKILCWISDDIEYKKSKNLDI